MAKKNKKNFIGNSKNVIWALLIVAAAVTVYGIAQAATVSHTPEEIAPQGPGSGLDSDTLWGLTSADILSAGGSTAAGGTLVQWGIGAANSYQPGDGAPACPTGWAESYSGFGPFIYEKEISEVGGGTSPYGYGYGYSTALSVCSPSSSMRASGTITTLRTYGGGGTNNVGTISACSQGPYPSAVYCNTCRVCVPKQTQTTDSGPGAGNTLLYAVKTTYTGNLGGRSGADSKCNSELPPELNGKVTNIHAFLSAASNDEIRDMHTVDSDNDGTKQNWYETSNPIYGYNRYWAEWTQIASNWRDLLDGNIAVSLNKATSTTNGHWTGSSAEGSAMQNCGGWTGSGNGQLGNPSAINSNWLRWQQDDGEGSAYDVIQSCGSKAQVICAAKYTG